MNNSMQRRQDRVVKPLTVNRKNALLLAAASTALMSAPSFAQTNIVASDRESPFSITVDGQAVDSNGNRSPSGFGADRNTSRADQQRKTDVDLSAVDIQLKAEGLELHPFLNVSTSPPSQSFRAGDVVSILATSNYPSFIDRAEIRITDVSSNYVEVLPVLTNDSADWVMPEDGGGRYRYTLRVYDDAGRFDETEPRALRRTRRFFQSATTTNAVAPGMAEDRTAVRNIPINGSAVTVFGRNVPPGYDIQAFGDKIPVDPNRAFVAQRILPPGEHDVNVSVSGTSKTGELRFRRNIDIPENQWFYVALVDLTAGQSTGSENIEAVREGDFDEVYADGRVAFYLKGRIRGRYLLTAAADLEDDSLDELFGARDLKDPRSILARINPDEFYPVYGDDSVITDDAPTDGRLFVRLERGDSHAMWGTYQTQTTESEFVRSDRELYGASAAHRSEGVTEFGERRTEVSAYAAQPDTLPQRDEFIATGGSSYFLRRQDILVGSETVTIETRDRVTGRVTTRTALSKGADYSFNHLQGLLLLNRSVAPSTSANGPVRDGALGGDDVFVIVQYEFVPLATDTDTYSYGGRGQHWVNDNLRVGISQMTEKVADNEHTAVAADILIRKSDKTYLEVEIGRSDGAIFSSSVSANGGLSVSDKEIIEFGDGSSDAIRVDGALDLAELGQEGLQGQIGGFYEEREAGFSTLTNQTPVDQELVGVYADLALTETVDLQVSHDQLSDDVGQVRRATELAVIWKKDERLTLFAGVVQTEIGSPAAIAANKPGANGERVDLGARIDYQANDDTAFYAFGQAEVSSNGDIAKNDRIGVGASFQLSDKVSASGEISTGETGLGALAALSYAPTATDRYYLGYRLDPDRQFDLNSTDVIGGVDQGVIVAGGRRRINQSASIYAEQNYDLFGRRQSLAQTYGIEYTPNARWSLDGGFQIGEVRDTSVDPVTNQERSDFERRSLSFGINYTDDSSNISGYLRGEVVSDRSEDGSRDGDSYFLNTRLALETSDDWRILVGAQAVVSEPFGEAFEAGEFLDMSIGYAYRPVDNDRLNALFRYRYVYDDHEADQIDVENGLRQESHILSVDANYRIAPSFTLGAKYGYRFGESSFGSEESFQDSEAHLGIIRGDYHVTDNWDLLLEGRVLNMPSADTTDFGFLASVHRHVGDNIKIGIGHNFGSFSDDLADQTFDDSGLFFNVVAKF